MRQQSIPPQADLRKMLRAHIVGRSLAAAERRQRATASPHALDEYRNAPRNSAGYLADRHSRGMELM